MDKRYLTTPCGLACFDCQFFEENITDQIRQGISEVRDIPIEDTGCKGCREEGGYCKYLKYECKTWKCVQEKGIEFCSDCNQFPCSYLAPTFKGANFPHNMCFCQAKNGPIDRPKNGPHCRQRGYIARMRMINRFFYEDILDYGTAKTECCHRS